MGNRTKEALRAIRDERMCKFFEWVRFIEQVKDIIIWYKKKDIVLFYGKILQRNKRKFQYEHPDGSFVTDELLMALVNNHEVMVL